MTWESNDPIDRGIGTLCRNPRTRKILAVILVEFVAIYGLSLATTSLNRVGWLAPIRIPFNALHTITQTHQNWGMFYNFPQFSDFDVVIYTGHVTPDGTALDSPEALGPILPGFQDLNVKSQLRLYQYFRKSLIKGGSDASREYYLNTLRRHLAERNAQMENPPTHFGIELVVDSLQSPEEIRKSGIPALTTRHYVGPLPIVAP